MYLTLLFCRLVSTGLPSMLCHSGSSSAEEEEDLAAPLSTRLRDEMQSAEEGDRPRLTTMHETASISCLLLDTIGVTTPRSVIARVANIRPN